MSPFPSRSDAMDDDTFNAARAFLALIVVLALAISVIAATGIMFGTNRWGSQALFGWISGAFTAVLVCWMVLNYAKH
jgi:hypothetical protein